MINNDLFLLFDRDMLHNLIKPMIDRWLGKTQMSFQLMLGFNKMVSLLFTTSSTDSGLMTIFQIDGQAEVDHYNSILSVCYTINHSAKDANK